ncbi:MazG nucleotide pyrophosphohydrolase domain-containing protein [Bavariicoccus seileri]|uniref:MazG nucleotide pyrophosphohydrolase domain-containing protein n=1 Tax=Bavariicoccus seileri TaxID=549685 RepID=UPI003B832D62
MEVQEGTVIVEKREVLTEKLAIEALQSYLEEVYKGHPSPMGLFMKLVEEVGEVAEALNKIDGRKNATPTEDLKAELSKELADVIHYTVALASITDIDLASVIIEKDKEAAEKYHHDTNLATFLQRTQYNNK